jgi:hypothetical protein
MEVDEEKVEPEENWMPPYRPPALPDMVDEKKPKMWLCHF